MRSPILLAGVLILGIGSVPLCASSLDDKPFDQQTIEALEARVNQASPRDQCFLYAELVHQMTEVSLKQYAAGNVDNANGMLKQIQQFVHKIHLSVAGNDKRLKNAEILLRHTAFRLNEMLHSSNYEDRPLVAQTLAEVNQAENEAMMEVFRK
jgi:hypothetical protein